MNHGNCRRVSERGVSGKNLFTKTKFIHKGRQFGCLWGTPDSVCLREADRAWEGGKVLSPVAAFMTTGCFAVIHAQALRKGCLKVFQGPIAPSPVAASSHRSEAQLAQGVQRFFGGADAAASLFALRAEAVPLRFEDAFHKGLAAQNDAVGEVIWKAAAPALLPPRGGLAITRAPKRALRGIPRPTRACSGLDWERSGR
jgi:hypothetical protein